MKKIVIQLLLVFFSLSMANTFAAESVQHKHAERGHAHVLPKGQGIKHRHGNGAYGQVDGSGQTVSLKKQPVPTAPATNSQNIPTMHIHGHVFHEHRLPAEGFVHKHGNGVAGREFVEVANYPYDPKEEAKSYWKDWANMCRLSFIKGLPSKFNPYRDWFGYCNTIKNTKYFKEQTYEHYGPGGHFHYSGFEKDFARVLNMRVADYEKVKTSSRPALSASGSSGRCHTVRGYRRKNGSYVRSHTRCR